MSFSDWNRVKLKDITVKIGSGSTPRGGSQVYTDQGVTFVRSQNVYNNYFDYSGLVYINDEAAYKLRSVILEENDILLNITGDSVARCTIVPTSVIPGRVNQHVSIIRVDSKKADYKFIKYVLVSPRMQQIMLSLAKSGGTRAALTKGMIENFEIFLPSLKEQKAIADILSSLDEKIELNNQMNEMLEEMAQALFKRWFVDFEFPNEEGQPYKSSGGEMVESELGMIPRGWSVKGLGELINISSGKRPSKKSSEKDKEYRYPLIGASSIMGYVLEPLCEDKILVIGRVGTHGVVQRFCGPVWPSDNTLVIRTVYYEFINQILQRIDYSAINRGSTQPLITQTDIKNTKIIVPDKNLLKVYEEKCESLFNMIEHNEIEKVYLGSLRDTLLPKLMSGEIRVSDFES